MHKRNSLRVLIMLVLVLSWAGPSFGVSARSLAATSPTLGTAASYSVLAGQTVTNTGVTTIPGDLGVSPGSAITGFPPGVVTPPGTIHAADANAADAQIANTAAFTSLDQACDTTYTGAQDLTLVSPLGPGIYCADAFLLTGNLTLNGTGVWIFKSAATLTTSANSSVTGGDACNVWWRLVSSGTLGTGTAFIGNILASTSITLQTGASLNGRALAQTGAVTLDSNSITGSACLAPPVSAATPTTAAATATLPATQPAATSTAATPATTPEATQPAATSTPTIVPTTVNAATATPIVLGLPSSGGAPIRNDGFPSILVIVGGFGALALVFAVRAYRSTDRSK
ncbi:MAG: ice-binding family protein [Anaerolineaceae bacterium]|nr:ice-binding family protein [Anaerolineaceae bacterium]